MADVIDWPCGLLRPLDVSYFIQWKTREAGANLAGVSQIIAPDMGVWRVDITIPREFDGARLKQLEAKVSEMRGCYNIARLCVCDPYRYGRNVSPRQWPFSDGTWFEDGSGFADPSAGTQTLMTAQAAAVGDTALVVDLTNPVRPNFRTGDMFSANGFLYRVTSRSNGGAVNFLPPLRTAITAGAALITDPPRFHGRFVDHMQGQRTRELLRHGASITLSFSEAFDI